MTNPPGRHQYDHEMFGRTGRPRNLEDVAEDLRNLDASYRSAAAAAGPTARALIEASRAATYSRLAPLVADVDRTWNPTTVPNAAADSVSNTPTDRNPRFGRDIRPPTSAGTVPTVTTTYADAIGVSAPTQVGRPTYRNRVVDIVVKAAQAVRHPRRHRRG